MSTTAKSKETLYSEAFEIRDERDTGENTANRVGTMLVDLIDKDIAQDEKDAEQDNAIQGNADNIARLFDALAAIGGSDGISGGWKMYFVALEGGITPTTPSIENDYHQTGDYFDVHGSGGTIPAGKRWINEDVNPSVDEDTWAIWVWVVAGTPQTVEGPIRILNHLSGLSNGEDGEELEWIYYRTNYPVESTSAELNLKVDLSGCKIDGTVSPFSGSWADKDAKPTGWEDNPQGVTPSLRYEYAAFRRSSNNANGKRTWGTTGFYGPYLWSSYGKQGLDGDGIEYIFYASQNGTAPSSSDHDNWPPEWTDADPTSAFQNPEYTGPINNGWTDNPIDLEDEDSGFSQGAKQWVSIRKKRKWNTTTDPWTAASNSSEGDAIWGPFSEPALWNYYARDGVADAYVPDIKPETVIVNTDSNGNVESFTANVYIWMRHNSASLNAHKVNDGSLSANEFRFWVDTTNIGNCRSDSGTNTVYTSGNENVFSAESVYNDGQENTPSNSDNYIRITLTNWKDFADKTANIPIKIRYKDSNNSVQSAQVTLQLSGIASSQAITMYTSADVIAVDYYGNNCAPSRLYVGVQIGNNLYSNSINNSAGSAYSQGYTFEYTYTYVVTNQNNSTSTEVTTNPVAVSTSNEYFTLSSKDGNGHYYTWLTVVMKKDGRIVSYENIPFVRDGAPGIGHSAWNVSVLSTTITKSNTTPAIVSGELKFKVVGPDPESTVGALVNKGTDSFDTSDNTLDKPMLVVALGNEDYTYGGTLNNKISLSYSSGVWTATLTEAIPFTKNNVSRAFSTIQVVRDNNTVLASATVPMIMPGKDGDNAEPIVQALEAVIIRFKDYATLQNSSEIVRNGDTQDESGLTYKDIIYGYPYNAEYYYLVPNLQNAESYTGSYVYSNFTTLITNGILHPITLMPDSAFQTLLAKYAYIENLTASEIVVTKTVEIGGNTYTVPVAGITQGDAITNSYVSEILKGQNGNAINREDIRIWAGLPNENGRATTNNLRDCAFYVTLGGEMKATKGNIGGFTIGQDNLTNSNYGASIKVVDSYQYKEVALGEEAVGFNGEQAILSARNTTPNTSNLTPNTALYLRANSATYNNAFCGIGNGILYGTVAGVRANYIDFSGNNSGLDTSYSSNNMLVLRQGSTFLLNPTTTNIVVKPPRYQELKNTVGDGIGDASFNPELTGESLAIDMDIINVGSYSVTLAFEYYNGIQGNFPRLMKNDGSYHGRNDAPYITMYPGSLIRLKLVYWNRGSDPQYRAYVIVHNRIEYNV